jgi:hypothetical protein
VSYTRGLVPSWGHSIDTASIISGVASSVAYASNAWPTANLAIYIPIAIALPVVAKKLWLACGTTGTDNIDIGIFSEGGTKIVASGATAKVNSDAELVVEITDTLLAPGRYWIGVSCASNTATFWTLGLAVPNGAALGVMQEGSAHPLPATATMVALTGLRVPAAGIFLDTTAT